MKNFFSEILFDQDFDQLNNMVRWNGVNRIKDETVAHHSFMVTWFTRLIVEEVFTDNTPKLIATTYSIFHDFDEMFTGDILHTLKYNDINGEQIKNELDLYLKSRINHKFPINTTKTNDLLNNTLLKKDIPIYISKIVKISDWLSMQFYLQKEIDLGNRSVIPLREYCIEQLKKSIQSCLVELENQNEYIVNLKIFKNE
jgi:5'-deoxynucleotidase YfbR-like HD superfamily hydrolase